MRNVSTLADPFPRAWDVQLQVLPGNKAKNAYRKSSSEQDLKYKRRSISHIYIELTPDKLSLMIYPKVIVLEVPNPI